MKTGTRTLLKSAALTLALAVPTAANAWWGWGPGWGPWGPGWLGDGWGGGSFSISFGTGFGGYGRGWGYHPYHLGYPVYGYPVHGLPYHVPFAPPAAAAEEPEVAQK